MPRSRWPASSPPTRPSSGGSCAASSGRSSGSSRRRTPTPEELAGNEINAGLYAFDAAWLRRRIARPDAVGRDRRAVPDRPRPARPRGRPDRDRGRLRGRRPVRRHQRPIAAGRGRVEHARPAQRGPHAGRGHDARPVDGLPRLDGRARRRRHPRAERHPARRDDGRRRAASSAPAASSSMPRSARGAAVWASIVESSTVEDEATVGPFSHLRPGSVVGRGATVGNFAELKNTHLGPGSKQHHMSYLGDAEVGEGVNIGAGTITANYDGTSKHRDDDRRRGVHRRRHDARRPASRSARARGPAPAPSSPATSRPASWRSGSRPGSASRGRNPRPTTPVATSPDRRPTCPVDEVGTATMRDDRSQLVVIVVLPSSRTASSRPPRSRWSRIRRSRARAARRRGQPRGARGSCGLTQQPGRFLAVIQIGINFLGFLASAFAAVSLVDGPGRPGWRRLGPLSGRRRAARPRRRDRPPDDLHDHLRRARAQADRPRPRRAVRAVDEPPHRRPAASCSARSWRS